MLTSGGIATFAVLDLETTGLVKRNIDDANITEIAIYGIAAGDIRNAINCDIPRICHKLTLLFNPLMRIEPMAADLSGLDNDILLAESSFDTNAANSLISFLKHLRQPVCLVAHNGNRFDFRLLKRALDRLQMELPANTVCIDSLVAFKNLDRSRANYKLKTIYRDVFATDPEALHQAEADVITLAKLMLHYKNHFVDYAEGNLRKFRDTPT